MLPISTDTCIYQPATQNGLLLSCQKEQVNLVELCYPTQTWAQQMLQIVVHLFSQHVGKTGFSP